MAAELLEGAVGATTPIPACVRPAPVVVLDTMRIVEPSGTGTVAWREDDNTSGDFVAAPAGGLPWIVTNDRLVHGWDLATTTGEPCDLNPTLAVT